MKAVIAIDSFKGSLSSFQAGEAAASGIRAVYPDAQCTVCELADGGEGTVSAVVNGNRGRFCRVYVTGPLGETVEAEYGVIEATRTAVIEMSAAAGVTLVAPALRNPMQTTTYGVGELIAHAIRVEGCRKFIIGIGGSATNDGGVGMLQALGYSFLDEDGKEIARGAEGLSRLSKIEVGGAMQELSECTFYIACDVTNPLCGTNGCSAVYGPQKGATPRMIAQMDAWLSRYAELSADATGIALADTPGTGAAGGMGFAFLTYLRGTLTSGIELVMRETGLESTVKSADIVVTGEGRLDGQTCMGKAPVGVARLAKRYDKPVVAFSGCVTEEAGLCNEHGIDAFFSILRTVCTLEEAMDPQNASQNLQNTVEQAFRLIRLFAKELGKS